MVDTASSRGSGWDPTCGRGHAQEGGSHAQKGGSHTQENGGGNAKKGGSHAQKVGAAQESGAHTQGDGLECNFYRMSAMVVPSGGAEAWENSAPPQALAHECP